MTTPIPDKAPAASSCACVAAINQQRAELDRLERERASMERTGASPDAIRDMQRRQKALVDAATSY